jgi:hypothetical protein
MNRQRSPLASIAPASGRKPWQSVVQPNGVAVIGPVRIGRGVVSNGRSDRDPERLQSSLPLRRALTSYEGNRQPAWTSRRSCGSTILQISALRLFSPGAFEGTCGIVAESEILLSQSQSAGRYVFGCTALNQFVEQAFCFRALPCQTLNVCQAPENQTRISTLSRTDKGLRRFIVLAYFCEDATSKIVACELPFRRFR